MTLTPQQKESIIKAIEGGDAFMLIVGTPQPDKGEGVRTQKAMVIGNAQDVLRDVTGAIDGDKNVNQIIRAAVTTSDFKKLTQ